MKLKLTSRWPFGKYKGTDKTIGDTVRDDPQYCKHMIDNAGPGYTVSVNVHDAIALYNQKLLEKDTSRWAKKFDTVAHLYAENGTVCGSSAYCLGNNYATKAMQTCVSCLKISLS